MDVLSLHGIPLALQVGMPIVLMVWLARGGSASISLWLLKAATVFLYLSAAHVAGLWLLLPWYTAEVFAIGVLALAVLQLPRLRRLPWTDARVPWPSVVGCGVIAAFAVAVLAAAVAGRRLPHEQVIDLQFPLRSGVYYVAGGGSRELLNPHITTLTSDRFRAYRGQSYGYDLVRLGAYGMRASGLLPADPARYAIYGDPVHAPCSGQVVGVLDGAPDMPPPQADRTRMAGNYVRLDCDGVHVLLAHLQPGSVRVRVSESVEAGAIVGRVGNSGNSNEPHLHIHAQRPAPAGRDPLSGDPLPVRFNGRFLVRNDRVSAFASR